MPWNGVTVGCAFGCWELGLGPLKEQPVMLTISPALCNIYFREGNSYQCIQNRKWPKMFLLRVEANLKDLASKPEIAARAHTYTINSQITKEEDGNDAGACASEYKHTNDALSWCWCGWSKDPIVRALTLVSVKPAPHKQMLSGRRCHFYLTHVFPTSKSKR